MEAVVSQFARVFFPLFAERVLREQPVQVIRERNGDCNCGFNENDPNSYHLAICPANCSTISLDGREVIIPRDRITIVREMVQENQGQEADEAERTVPVSAKEINPAPALT